MRRFEFSDDKSNKFWEVDVSGTEVTVHFGRMGTAGQTKTKDHGTPEKAQAECDKLIRAKAKKGYAEVQGQDAVTLAPVPAPVPVAASPKGDDAVAEVKAATPPAPSPAPGDALAPTVAPPTATSPSPASEEQLNIPADCRAKILPRRGQVPIAGGPSGDASKLFEVARRNLDLSAWRPEILTEELQPIAQAVLVRLQGAPTAPWSDCVAEGLLARLVNESGPKPLPRLRALFDYWTLTGGLAKAVTAALESLTFAAHEGTVIARQTTASVKRGTPLQGWKVTRVSHAGLSTTERGFLVSVRGALAAADDDAYAAALAEVHALVFQGRELIDIAAAFVFPTEAFAAKIAKDWRAGQGEPLLTVTNDIEDIEQLVGFGASFYQLPSAWVWTVLDNVGAELFGVLASTLDHWDSLDHIASALGHIPTDEAFSAMLDHADVRWVKPALVDASMRFPRRAMRLLCPVAARSGKASMNAKSLVRAVVRKYPGLAAEVVPELSEAAARLLIRLDQPLAVCEIAEPDALPAVLGVPPWLTSTKRPKVASLPLTPIEMTPTEVWREGEKEQWALQRGWAGDTKFATLSAAQIEAWVTRLVGAQGRDNYELAAFLVSAPKDAARKVLASQREWSWYLEDWMPAIVARLGTDTEVLLTTEIKETPTQGWAHAAPVGCASFAPKAASAFSKKSQRALAVRWLTRHAELAAVALLPAALGKAGRARAEAEVVLRYLATHGHADVLRTAAARYGEQAVAGLDAVLAVDPLLQLPKKIPPLPPWFDAAVLQAPRLRDATVVLGPDAVGHLVTMLAMSNLETPYAGVALVAEACTPESLDTFVWDLFEAWSTAGSVAKQGWALIAVGLLGGNESARRLTPLIRAWPSDGGFAKANTGLDVLAAIGTDVALMHLNGIANKVKSKALQKRAQDKVAEVAEELGLTADDLADRLVPDLGLDPGGSLSLDYGRRRFTVGFDEQLRPFVRDSEGKRLKDLPKPGKNDTTEPAEAAHKRWKALKKDARAVAKQQVERLEVAMCRQRRWPSEMFSPLFVEHPLLIHIVRRLVWGVFDADGGLVSTFRVAEDSSLAGSDDEAFELAAGTTVGIVHAVELPAESAATWGELFADYELLAPFPQLGRDVFAIDAEEGELCELKRVEGKTVDTGRVLRLVNRGWARGSVEDGGVSGTMERELSGGNIAVLWLDPGIIVGMPTEFETQTLGVVSLHRGGSGWEPKGSTKLRTLGAAEVSELIRDLNALLA